MANLTEFVSHLVCDSCGQKFEAYQVDLTCTRCGPDLGTLTIEYDFDRVAQAFTTRPLQTRTQMSHWRYQELLPINRPVGLHPRVGGTPLYRIDSLADHLNIAQLWIKDDGLNPSASFKDRATAMAVAGALADNHQVVCAASTGNAASSLALFAACVGIKSYLFVPHNAPQAKIAQLLIFGANVLAVNGTYDEAFDLCLQTALEHGWYCRNTAINPVLSEGKKTAAFEICEQLDFHVPDLVLVGAGDGCIIGGLWKGFVDFHRLGLIKRLPRLIGVQAAGACALVTAYQSGSRTAKAQSAKTLADSICVGQPRDHIKALRAVSQSKGAFIAVEDDKILQAMCLLAQKAGVFAEPAGAAGMAGLIQLHQNGELNPKDKVVVIVTGNGLKDIASAIQAVRKKPTRVEATLDSVANVLAQCKEDSH